MKEVMPGIFVENVTLGITEIPAVNIIVIKGTERSLLIDAGITPEVRPIYRETLLRVLHDLDISFDRLDCIVTHCHPDHLGMVRFLQEQGVPVYLNPEEKRHEDELIYYQVVNPVTRKKVFHTMGLLRERQPKAYELLWDYSQSVLGDLEDLLHFDYRDFPAGSVLNCGGYRLEAVSLPGHSYGQIGLWDSEKQILFCADHIMKGISPVVGTCHGTDSYLGRYLDSMRDIKGKYRNALFIPGHGPAFRNGTAEADRIIFSYLSKCSAMLDILKKAEAPMCIRDIGVLAYGRDAESPEKKQFLSCILIWAKTYACLKYMEEQEMVQEHIEDETPYWTALIK